MSVQRLLLLGLNHTTAPLAVRERIAFTPAQQQAALEQFRAQFPHCEAVLVSTCNRVELYTARPVHGHPRAEEMILFLAQFHALPLDFFASHLYQKSNQEAVEHLFSVASSLDSMVLGETQILGQVRESYELARRSGMTGSLLNPLFQRAIAVGRQVMADTPLGEGQLSIASVAVNYARGIFEYFDDKTVLSIGAGEMSSLVLRSFRQLNPGRLLVANRDLARAEALAAEHGGAAARLDELDELLVGADVVVSSTGADEPILTRERVEALLLRRHQRPLFMIDIAIPRDIDPAVGEIDNVYLYNLDDLQRAVSSAHLNRQDAVAAARAIVDRQVEAFAAWHRARELGPSIDALYRRFHELAQEEVERTITRLPEAGDAERAELHELARRIVNKLLHDPVKTLRAAEGLHGPTAQYLHAVEKLSQLDPSSGGNAGTPQDDQPRGDDGR